MRAPAQAGALARVSLGHDALPDGAGSVFLAWIAPGAFFSGDALWLRAAGEQYGHGHYELSPANPGDFCPVGEGAREPLCPRSNFARLGSLFNAALWREGDALVMRSVGGEARVGLASTARVVRPALLDELLTTSVLFVSDEPGGSASLRVARFDSVDDRSAPVPSLGKPLALPFVPAVFAAALEAREGGRKRYAVFLGEHEARVRVLLAALDGGGSLREAFVAHSALIEGSAPALYVGPDGAARVGFAVHDRERGGAALVELLFEPERAEAKLARYEKCAAPGAVAAACVAYGVRSGGRVELSACWSTEDGAVYARGHAGGLERVRGFMADKVHELFVGRDTDALVVQRSDGVFTFETV